jgi:hypothetical protein
LQHEVQVLKQLAEKTTSVAGHREAEEDFGSRNRWITSSSDRKAMRRRGEGLVEPSLIDLERPSLRDRIRYIRIILPPTTIDPDEGVGVHYQSAV